MTTTRATISSGYRFRLLIIALGLTGFGVWSLYDGYVAYPKKIEDFQKLETYKAEHDDWQTSWQEYALAEGLPTNVNDIKPLEAKDITTQYMMAAFCLPIGLWFLWGFVRAGGRWVEADEQGLRDNKGRDAAWSVITGLGDDRWKTKGIAYVEFVDPQGATGRILLDDWKFDREKTTAIYQQVLAKVRPEEAQAVETDADAAPAPEAGDVAEGSTG